MALTNPKMRIKFEAMWERKTYTRRSLGSLTVVLGIAAVVVAWLLKIPPGELLRFIP